MLDINLKLVNFDNVKLDGNELVKQLDDIIPHVLDLIADIQILKPVLNIKSSEEVN